MSPDKDPYGHKKRELYSYVQLFGAWLHLHFPGEVLTSQTTDFLRSWWPPSGKVISGRGVPPGTMISLGYPWGMLADWCLYPSDHWGEYQSRANEALNKIENYRAFADLVRSEA